MNPVDIAVIVVVSVAAAGVVAYLIYRKLKRKGGCCDCGESCGGSCPYCNGKKEDK